MKMRSNNEHRDYAASETVVCAVRWCSKLELGENGIVSRKLCKERQDL